MLRKCDFPDPKWPFRKAPRPSGRARELETISRHLDTSSVTTKVSRIIRRRSGFSRSLSWMTVLISGISMRSRTRVNLQPPRPFFPPAAGGYQLQEEMTVFSESHFPHAHNG